MNEGNDPRDPNQPPPQTEQLQHSSVAARVPDKVAQGVFSTGVVVMEGPEEYVIDFIQGITRPPRVAARVIVSPNVMGQFVGALRDNLSRYEQSFGPPKPLPQPPQPERRRSIQEMYEDLKMPDEVLTGAYATTVMIGHSPSEFFMDFITRFFPHAAVSARVYVAASQLPQVLQALSAAHQNRQNREKRPPEPN